MSRTKPSPSFTSLLSGLIVSVATVGCGGGGGGGGKPEHAAATKSYELAGDWVLTETVKTTDCEDAVDLKIGDEFVSQYQIRQSGNAISLYQNGKLIVQGTLDDDKVTMSGRYVDASISLELLTSVAFTVIDDDRLTGTESANFKNTDNGFSCRVQFGVAGERGEMTKAKSNDAQSVDAELLEPTALSLNASVSGAVNSANNPQDQYRLALAAGDHVSLSLDGYSDTGSNLDLYVYDQFGNEITSSHQGGDAAESVQLSLQQDDHVIVVVVAQDTAAQTIDYALQAISKN